MILSCESGVVAIETQDTVKVEVWDVVDKGESNCSICCLLVPRG